MIKVKTTFSNDYTVFKEGDNFFISERNLLFIYNKTGENLAVFNKDEWSSVEVGDSASIEKDTSATTLTSLEAKVDDIDNVVADLVDKVANQKSRIEAIERENIIASTRVRW